MSNEFTKLAVRHPVGYSLGSGGVLVVIALTVFRLHPAFAFAAGSLLALFNWTLWRPGGFGRRHEGEVGDEPVQLREIVKFVVLTMVLSGLMFLVYWLAE